MFLGIDLGTSGVKAVLVDESERIADQATAPLAVSRPHPLWSEQSPEDWWSATCAAVGQLEPALRARVSGIGLSGQMHGATVLDESDRPLRPAILWNDGRAHEECGELEQAEARSREITGNIAMPGFTAPKLLWLRKHEPEHFAKTRTVLLPKDYLRLRMSGERISDMSDASGTLWLDCAMRAWSDEMLAATGLDRKHMPALAEGNDVAGMLRNEIAREWGMTSVPIAAGAGDNAAGAVGVGAIDDGEALLSLGTSGVVFVANGDFRPNPLRAVHAFCHCLPGRWHQMSVHLSAASCLDWAANQLGLGGPADLLEVAEREGLASGPELFLPYLSGERTPHNDPHLRAALVSLDADTSPGRIANAVLEGVAFALADGVAALREAGTNVDRLSLVGGGARSRYWGSIIASAVGAELDYLDGGEVGPALGAARLGRMAATGEAPDTVCKRPPVVASVSPDPLVAERLLPKITRFRRFAEAAKTI